VTFLLIILLVIAAIVVVNVLEHQKVNAMPPAERERYLAAKRDRQATAAVLTGGVSMLATGLSRKEKLTQARCDNCHNQWDF
jgi:hypothetical protein